MQGIVSKQDFPPKFSSSNFAWPLIRFCLKNHECGRGRDRFADVLFLRTHGCAHSPKDCLAGLFFSKTKKLLQLLLLLLLQLLLLLLTQNFIFSKKNTDRQPDRPTDMRTYTSRYVAAKNISKLEEVDKILLRKIQKAHTKTPVESLYLELGVLPLNYIMKCRRIMYLHYILTQDKKELLSKCTVWKIC